MAKSRIQGITLEFGADFADVEKGLKELNSTLGKTQSDLRDVDKLLKLDPENTELVAQKQRLLSKAAEDTRKKLQSLKQAQDKMRAATKNGANATQEQQRKMDALEREIAQTSAQLKKYERAMDGATDETKDFSRAADDAGKSAGGIMETLGKFKGAAIGGAVVGGITAAASALGDVYENSKELRMDLSKLSQNATENGATIDEAKDAWREFSIITGETDSSVEAVSNLLQARLKGNNLERAIQSLGGAVVRFPDTMKVESLADSLQETLATKTATGQYAELLERCGVNLDKFNAGLQKCKTDAEAQNYALKVLEEEGLHGTYEAYKENNQELLANNEAQLKQQEALAKLGEAIEPFVTAFAEGMTTVIGWIEKVVGWVQTAVQWFTDLLTKIGDFLFAKRQVDTKKLTTDATELAKRLGWDGKSPYLPGYANGGTLTSGAALVGERGPELLTMQGGRAVVEPLYQTNKNAHLTSTFNMAFNNGSFTRTDAMRIARMMNLEIGKLFR